MLSQPNRLSLRTERIRLEKDGVTRHSPLFIVVAASKRSEDPAYSRGTIPSPPRFAVLVSKKLAPLSVKRHLLRRIITEVLRRNLDKFPPGRDYLVIPKKPILTASQDQILSDLKQLCS